MERQVKAAMKITMFRKNEGYSSQSESLHVRQGCHPQLAMRGPSLQAPDASLTDCHMTHETHE